MDQVSIWVNASPERVWAMVSDVTRYGGWSPENQGGHWVNGAQGADVGAKFIGVNQHGLLRWKTHCTVIECQDNSRFAFAVAESRTQWGFYLEAKAGGTRLTEWRERVGVMPLPFRLLENSGLLGKPRDIWVVDGMRQTLEAIKRSVEQTEPGCPESPGGARRSGTPPQSNEATWTQTSSSSARDRSA